MTVRTPTQTPTSRRARREAQRRANRAVTPPERGRSPILWITIGAVAIGVVLLAVLVLMNRPAAEIALTPPSEATAVELADGRAMGAADAPATLHIWADFQCPGCGLLATSAEARLIREVVPDGQLRIEFHDYAFLGEESTQAAIAARAAGRQDAFWPYHDWLFANQRGENRGAFRPEVLEEIARRLGLDVERFRADMADAALADEVRAETAAGTDVPVTATPTLVIGEKVFTGVPAWDELKAAIDAEIARASGGPSTP